MIDNVHICYELENPIIVSLILIFVLILLATALLVFIRYLIQKNGKSFLFAFIGLFFGVMILTLISSETDAIRIYNQYKKGDYYLVEGIVEQYNVDYDKAGNERYDVFYVEGVKFVVNGTDVGYTQTKSRGSKIEKGVYVRICYIPYQNINVITRLEILE